VGYGRSRAGRQSLPSLDHQRTGRGARVAGLTPDRENCQVRTRQNAIGRSQLYRAGLVVIGSLGVLCLSVGAWKVFFADGGPGLTALLVIGAVLTVCPFVLPRLVAVALSLDGFEFRMSEQIAREGAEETARTIDNTELAALADAYGTIRSVMPGNAYKHVRVPIQDMLVDRAEALAASEPFDATELRELFPKTTPVVRVLILGLMKGNTALADAGVIETAIRSKETDNEQYHALLLAERCWERLSPEERTSIQSAIGDRDLGTGARRAVADKILAYRSEPSRGPVVSG
jgi:hypothetical protein